MIKKNWIILGGLVILAAAFCGEIFWYLHRGTRNSGVSPLSFVPSGGTDTLGSATSTAGYLSYANQQYHFSLLYPPDLQMKQYGGGGNALTVAFQDPATNKGFQVFVVPYDAATITKQRFEMDEPSGEIENSVNVIIDGVQAELFYSANATMGDTVEVWFINGGLLYEVTSYKDLDGWLGGIMQTWQFTQ